MLRLIEAGGLAGEARSEVGPELAVGIRRGERVARPAALGHPHGEAGLRPALEAVVVVVATATGSPPSSPVVNASTAIATAASTSAPATAVPILTPRAPASAA